MAGDAIHEDLQYTNEHERVRVHADAGNLVVGITDFAQDALGDVGYVSLPKVGDVLALGDVLGEIESTKSVSELYAPVDGTVARVNETLNDTPELVNTDPYGAGWILEISSPLGQESLLDAAAYRLLTNPE